MNRAKKLSLLLCVLAVTCAAAFAALHLEQRQEQIKTSGETVLSIDVDAVQALSWTCEGESLAFHRDGETWLYDGDETFPVDSEAIRQLLEQFQDFGAAFIEEDSSSTYCDDDVYFTQQNGQSLPLDTSRVKAYLRGIRYLELTGYVTYNASDGELAAYGLDDPELTVTVDYTYEDEAEKTVPDVFTLHISRDSEQRRTTERSSEGSDGEEDLDAEITAYVRVGQSQIVYQVSAEEYQDLMAASYNDLRHQELFSGDFADITQLDVSLDGAEYTIVSEEKSGERTYFYQEEELDISDLQKALEALTAEEFTGEKPAQARELGLTLHLDNDNFPEVLIELYRYNGTHCLAVGDGEPFALVPRSQAVDLAEALRTIVLN